MSKTNDDKMLLLESKMILSNSDLPTNVTITEPMSNTETVKDSVIKVSLVVTCCPKEDCEKCESCNKCESCETCEDCLCEKNCQCNSCEKKQKETNSCPNIFFMKWFSFFCCKTKKNTDDVLPSDKIETDIIPETQPDK